MNYNAIVDLGVRSDDDNRIIDALGDYHGVLAGGRAGTLEAIITIPAESLRQAATTALAVCESATRRPAVAIEVMPTDLFDRRHGLEPLPEQLSVTEVAQLLGVSRQAVLQRIDAGSLPATRVGRSWAVRADVLDRTRSGRSGTH